MTAKTLLNNRKIMFIPVIAFTLLTTFAITEAIPRWICDLFCRGTITFGHQTVQANSLGSIGIGDFHQQSNTVRTSDVEEFGIESSYGSFTLDQGASSTFTLTSQQADGVPFFPATLTASIDVNFNNTAGQEFTSDEATEWSAGTVNQWPVQQQNWNLLNEVTFVNGSEEVVLNAANTDATLR